MYDCSVLLYQYLDNSHLYYGSFWLFFLQSCLACEQNHPDTPDTPYLSNKSNKWWDIEKILFYLLLLMKTTGKSFNLLNKPTASTAVGGIVTKDDASATAWGCSTWRHLVFSLSEEGCCLWSLHHKIWWETNTGKMDQQEGRSSAGRKRPEPELDCVWGATGSTLKGDCAVSRRAADAWSPLATRENSETEALHLHLVMEMDNGDQTRLNGVCDDVLDPSVKSSRREASVGQLQHEVAPV